MQTDTDTDTDTDTNTDTDTDTHTDTHTQTQTQTHTHTHTHTHIYRHTDRQTLTKTHKAHTHTHTSAMQLYIYSSSIIPYFALVQMVLVITRSHDDQQLQYTVYSHHKNNVYIHVYTLIIKPYYPQSRPGHAMWSHHLVCRGRYEPHLKILCRH